MTTEQFQIMQAQMSNKELIKRVHEQVSKMCKTGGQSFTMSIPPRIIDTDIIITELLRRFEQAFEATENLTFGQALEWVKQGFLIAREGWNGKRMFVFMRPVQHLDPLFILKSVSTLPDSYKETLQNVTFQQEEKITFTAYLCMKAADNTVVNGWLASQTDMLATDWRRL